MSPEKQLQSVMRRFWADQAHEACLGGRLVVGVSGGADSLSLWHVLKTTAVVAPDLLTAVYVHHNLRPEADDEAQFVLNTAQAWGLSARVWRVDAPALVKSHGYSVEEAARLLRYEALVAVAREVGATCLLVAHTADDQAETVLMHLLRGSGMAGLRGMQPLSPLPESLGDGGDPLWVARPFLGVWRATIEAYCLVNGLTPVQDISNEDRIFLRNAVRHELLPHLAQYNPQIKSQLHHTAVILTAEDALLDELTQQAEAQLVVAEGAGWVRWQSAGWRAQSLAVQRRLLRQAWQMAGTETGQTLGFGSLEQARQLLAHGRVGQEAILPSGVRAVVGYETLLVASDTAVVPPEVAGPQLRPSPDQPVPLPVPGRVALADGWQLTAEFWTAAERPTPAQLTASPHEVYLAVSSNRVATDTAVWQVRGRLAGERFTPLGMAGHEVKLKEMMINRKIPAQLRDQWPLLVDEAGILWLVGVAQAERTAVRPESQAIVKVTLHSRAER